MPATTKRGTPVAEVPPAHVKLPGPDCDPDCRSRAQALSRTALAATALTSTRGSLQVKTKP
jgi:hypothetical protein